MRDWEKERRRVQRLLAVQAEKKKRGNELRSALKSTESNLAVLDKATGHIQTALQKARNEFAFEVCGLVTAALEKLLGKRYTFTLEFEIKRGQVEARPVLIDHDQKGLRLDLSGGDVVGGGVVDVVSLAFRLSLWSVERGRGAAPVFILDEPFRDVSKDLQPILAALLRGLADRLGVQFIIITHERRLAQEADRAFLVERKKDGSALISVLT